MVFKSLLRTRTLALEAPTSQLSQSKRVELHQTSQSRALRRFPKSSLTQINLRMKLRQRIKSRQSMPTTSWSTKKESILMATQPQIRLSAPKSAISAQSRISISQRIRSASSLVEVTNRRRSTCLSLVALSLASVCQERATMLVNSLTFTMSMAHSTRELQMATTSLVASPAAQSPLAPSRARR